MSEISDAIQTKCLAFGDRIIKLNDYLLEQAASKRYEVRKGKSAFSPQPSALSLQPSSDGAGTISHLPSSISHHPSSISHHPSAIFHHPSAP